MTRKKFLQLNQFHKKITYFSNRNKCTSGKSMVIHYFLYGHTLNKQAS